MSNAERMEQLASQYQSGFRAGHAAALAQIREQLDQTKPDLSSPPAAKADIDEFVVEILGIDSDDPRWRRVKVKEADNEHIFYAFLEMSDQGLGLIKRDRTLAVAFETHTIETIEGRRRVRFAVAAKPVTHRIRSRMVTVIGFAGGGMGLRYQEAGDSKEKTSPLDISSSGLEFLTGAEVAFVGMENRVDKASGMQERFIVSATPIKAGMQT